MQNGVIQPPQGGCICSQLDPDLEIFCFQQFSWSDGNLLSQNILHDPVGTKVHVGHKSQVTYKILQV